MSFASVPLVERFWARVQKTDTCWLWTGGPSASGYGQIAYGRNQPGAAHRVSWELHHGPIPDGLWVLHRCDVKLCVRPDHLFLGSALDNSRDMVRKGRSATGDRNGARLHPDRRASTAGEHNPRARLTNAQVRSIRDRARAGVPQRGLAAAYGVAESTVSRIVNRHGWEAA
jgi:hypothetical protein